MAYHSDRCCNPFKHANEKGHKGKKLRVLSKTMKIKFPNLPENAKICWKCNEYSKISEINTNITNQTAENVMDVDEGSLSIATDHSMIFNSKGASFNSEYDPNESFSCKNEMDVDTNSSGNSINPLKNTNSNESLKKEKNLEEILEGLKDKFKSLKSNDP